MNLIATKYYRHGYITEGALCAQARGPERRGPLGQSLCLKFLLKRHRAQLKDTKSPQIDAKPLRSGAKQLQRDTRQRQKDATWPQRCTKRIQRGAKLRNNHKETHNIYTEMQSSQKKRHKATTDCTTLVVVLSFSLGVLLLCWKGAHFMYLCPGGHCLIVCPWLQRSLILLSPVRLGCANQWNELLYWLIDIKTSVHVALAATELQRAALE